jgi:hypothetical protein
MCKRLFVKFAAAAAIAFAPVAAGAQITEVDPNDAGEYEPAVQGPAAQPQYDPSAAEAYPAEAPAAQMEYQPVEGDQALPPEVAEAAPVAGPAPARETVPRGDIFSAAENVFGRGAAGLGGLIERILKDQGEPSAYISGQEAGGAFVAGVRYGSGTMRHQTEGDRAVYWTGPTVGFDFGAGASKVFVLVYNLPDSSKLFKAFPAAEGHAYAVGGFTASYLRRGNVVLIPVRLGVGLRLGVNAGYMRFSEKNRWLPF